MLAIKHYHERNNESVVTYFNHEQTMPIFIE